MKSWRTRAYAKLNLGLRVLGKRADGYHDLDTLFLQIDLADTLFFEKTDHEGLELTCNWPDIPCNDSNLCARAYNLLSAATSRRLGLRMHLEKKIPAGAGLGGGSSDAAVTLIAVNQILEVGLSQAKLLELAAQMGSDVPFFLYGGCCQGAGRGEILSPIADFPEVWILLITPDIVVSTALVYQNVKIGLTNKQKNATFAGLKPGIFENYLPTCLGQNDLEAVVFEMYPELAVIKAKLQEGKALTANMTGSGSAVFGLFGSCEQAQRIQQAAFSGNTTFIARPVRWGMPEISADLYSQASGW